ncbi:hypothetical protein ZOSMA_133G00010 [Zostera marina]|uniref:Uncharacterized protein n=1 Tax=Zostera marina TaxID=29655 RepID=A0A0K9Q0Y4_ZOSMR|nr:hypothetical protein ZOSMA_133G00010 [Zostera marina]
MYFWAKMKLGSKDDLNFWLTCDILNNGNCSF